MNLHSSTITVGFSGIWDLDIEVAFYSESNPEKEADRLSLRAVLYKMLKLKDGHFFLAGIHQEHVMGDVEAVIPNTPEAEAMALMMEKNVAAYLGNYLTDVGMDQSYVISLLRASCDTSLLHRAAKCTWDKETRVLTTPEDVQAEKEKAIEEAAWYKFTFEEHMESPKKKGGKSTRTQRICTILTALTPSRLSLRGRAVGTAAHLERLPSRLEQDRSLRGRKRVGR